MRKRKREISISPLFSIQKCDSLMKKITSATANRALGKKRELREADPRGRAGTYVNMPVWTVTVRDTS
jgi:hypothetical protein